MPYRRRRSMRRRRRSRSYLATLGLYKYDGGDQSFDLTADVTVAQGTGANQFGPLRGQTIAGTSGTQVIANLGCFPVRSRDDATAAGSAVDWRVVRQPYVIKHIYMEYVVNFAGSGANVLGKYSEAVVAALVSGRDTDITAISPENSSMAGRDIKPLFHQRTVPIGVMTGATGQSLSLPVRVSRRVNRVVGYEHRLDLGLRCVEAGSVAIKVNFATCFMRVQPLTKS